MIALLGLGIAKAQVPFNYKLTLQDSTSYTDSVRIGGQQVPMGLYSDSSFVDGNNAAVALTLYVGFAANNTTPSKWYVVNNVTDTVAYTVKVKAGTFVPLNVSSMYPLIGTFTSDSPAMWLKIKTATTQSTTKTIYVRTRLVQ